MGIKSIPLKKFRKFLKHIGCIKIRIQSSHEIWDKTDGSLLRPIVVDNNYKDVPTLAYSYMSKNAGNFKRRI